MAQKRKRMKSIQLEFKKKKKKLDMRFFHSIEPKVAESWAPEKGQ